MRRYMLIFYFSLNRLKTTIFLNILKATLVFWFEYLKHLNFKTIFAEIKTSRQFFYNLTKYVLWIVILNYKSKTDASHIAKN